MGIRSIIQKKKVEEINETIKEGAVKGYKKIEEGVVGGCKRSR